MPTWTDDIGDAPLLAGANSDTVSNVGATEEATENAQIGWPTVWTRIDLSAYPAGSDVEITLGAAGAAGFFPYVEVMKVIDGTFDPNSPDFSKLDYMFDTYVGDGTDSPPDMTFDLKGGVAGSSGSSFDYRSESGIFYVFFTDWDFAGYGSATVTSLVPPPPICLDAEDVINPSSTTASVVSGRVRETYDGFLDREEAVENQPQAALKWTWAGPAGVYKVSALGRAVNPGGATYFDGGARIMIAVNGKPVYPTTTTSTGGFDTDVTWFAYPGFTGGTYDKTDYGEAPWVALSPGQEIEVFVISTVRSATTFLFVPFDLEELCFYEDPAAPASTYCTAVFAFPDEPLGDAWGSPNGWGGQRFIPEYVWTETGITPYDEADFAWGVNWSDYDFVALANGNVYVIYHDEVNNSTGNAFPFADGHPVVVKKWDGSSWTELAELNVRPVNDGYYAQGVSAYTDGTDVYFAWWELETYTVGPPAKHLYHWHLVRLDPSTDTITELGTGQNAQGVTVSNQNYLDSVETSAICVSGGDVYVANQEYSDDVANDARHFVWRYTAGAWTNLALPDPTLLTPPWSADNGENGFWDQLVTIVDARASGPVTDGFTLAYTYRHNGSDHPLVTIPYTVGTGWGTAITTDLAAIETGRLNDDGAISPPNPYGVIPIDMDLMWSENEGRLVLALDLLNAINASEQIWDVLRLNAGGTQWELLNDIAPGNVSGPWRQSRNTAAIGPDGEVYRALMSDTVAAVLFEPKVIKTAGGHLAGYAVAGVPAMGERPTAGDDMTWQPYMYGTTLYRIRIVGRDAYVMVNLFTERYDHATQTAGPDFADGVFIFKLSYAPCTPHILNLRASIPL